MVNKEELQKHIQSLNEIKTRYPILYDTIKYLEEYQKTLSNPTLDDCIKEWEERGWRWHMDKICIKLINKEDEDIDIHMWLSDKTYAKAYKEFYQYITLEEHNLIHKTLKALEVKDG